MKRIISCKRLRDGRLPVMTIEEADGRVAAFAAVGMNGS